jgi:RNA polymerase sigma-70 factor (ECF subfamily)
MPEEPMNAIGGANTMTSSPDRWVAQQDAALVASAKAGDARPLEVLVERHERRIFSLAQRMTRNREDAEDVMQQSFQKAFTHLKKFEGESLFSTWLTRIAINEALMLLRRRRGTREVPIAESSTEDGAALPLDFPDSGPNPEDSCLQREQERILSAAVSQLTPGMRKAIELRETSRAVHRRNRSSHGPVGRSSEGTSIPRAEEAAPDVEALCRIHADVQNPGVATGDTLAIDFDRTKTSTKGGRTMTRLSFLKWYRILLVHHQWTMFQAIRYALWLAR